MPAGPFVRDERVAGFAAGGRGLWLDSDPLDLELDVDTGDTGDVGEDVDVAVARSKSGSEGCCEVEACGGESEVKGPSLGELDGNRNVTCRMGMIGLPEENKLGGLREEAATGVFLC